MKVLFALLAISALLFTSCQAELDPSIITNPSGQDSLLKSVTSTKDTTTDKLVFEYNSAKQLTGYTLTFTTPSEIENYDFKLTRNGSGIVTRMVVFADFPLDLDSAVSIPNYDNVIGRYKTLVTTSYYPNRISRDSVNYIYDAQGRLIETVTYADNSLTTGYEQDQREQYEYAGATLIKWKSYSFIVGNFNPSPIPDVITFEYDNKINPFRLADRDAYLLGVTTFYPANNRTKAVSVDSDPFSSDNYTEVTSHIYNAGNKPIRSTTTGNGSPEIITYTYQ